VVVLLGVIQAAQLPAVLTALTLYFQPLHLQVVAAVVEELMALQVSLV
jgi:hypothetical protein